MTALTDLPPTSSQPVRRRRAGATAQATMRGGLIGAAVAAGAWVLAGIVAATAFTVLLLVSVAAGAYAFVRGRLHPGVWGGLAVAWAVVLLERWVVGGHGGLWVAIAAWFGVVAGARRAGISKWALPLLAFPLIGVALALVDRQSLLSPWGSAWLWVPIVLLPVIAVGVVVGARSNARNA